MKKIVFFLLLVIVKTNFLFSQEKTNLETYGDKKTNKKVFKQGPQNQIGQADSKGGAINLFFSIDDNKDTLYSLLVMNKSSILSGGSRIVHFKTSDISLASIYDILCRGFLLEDKQKTFSTQIPIGDGILLVTNFVFMSRRQTCIVYSNSSQTEILDVGCYSKSDVDMLFGKKK